MGSKNIFCFKFIPRLITILLLSYSIFSAGSSNAAIHSGYTEFYIPVSEDQIWDVFWELDGEIAGYRNIHSNHTMHAVISVSATGDSTTVYYDHWEDGYDFDPDNPAATADEIKVLDAGDVWKLESSHIPVNPRNPAQIFYDGRDRLYVAGASVSVSRSSWIEEIGTVLAVSWDIYPVKPFLTDYTIPVGENLASAPKYYRDFERVYLFVMSTHDDNPVEIDDPTTPNTDLTVSLNRGEVTQLHNVNAGTRISASKPVQVQFIVAGVQTGRYETRGYNCVPDGLWDTEYYSPVDGGLYEKTDLYIYNPNNSLMLVDYEDRTGSGTFTVPAKTTLSYQDGTGRYVPNGSGVYLRSDDVFWGIGSVDTESTSKDWGFTLVPNKFLTNEYFLSWAPGSSDAVPSVNGSPAFITPVQDDTIVKVDYSPADGIWDKTYLLDRLETKTLFDPDNDNTGMHIWASGPLSVVWGQDPDVSGPYAPYLDLGSSILPLSPDWMDLILGIEGLADPSVLAPKAGEVTTIRLEINSYDYPVSEISVKNILPDGFSYVQGTTEILFPDNTTLSGSPADPAVSGQTIQWNNATLSNLNMGPNEILYIAFDAVTDTTVEHGTYTNYAQARGIRLDGSQVFSPFDSSLINVTAVTVDKDTITPSVTAGDAASYTIEVKNISDSNVTNVVITDSLPPGFTFDSVTIPINETDATRTSTNNPAHGAANLQWNSWTINPGGSVFIEFSVNVAGTTAPKTYDNTATVSFGYESTTYTIDDKGSVSQDLGTPSGTDPEDDEDVTVTSLTIDKDNTTPSGSAGNTGQYTITLVNSSSAPINNVSVYDSLPEFFTYNDSETSIDFTGGASFSSAAAPSAGASNLEWSDFDIPAEATVTITFVVNIDAAALPGTYDNTAYAYSSQTGFIDDAGNVAQDRHTPVDEDPENDEDITVESALLTIDKDTSTPYAIRGITQGSYSIRVENIGNAAATGVVIEDTLPSWFSLDLNSVSITDTEPGAVRPPEDIINPADGATNLQWGTWTIDPGGSVVIEFNVDIPVGTTPGTYDNTASATYSGGSIVDNGTIAQDPDTPSFADPEDDEDITVFEEIDDVADLSIIKTHGTNFTAGQTGIYSIVVTNNGPGTAGDVTITENLPVGLTYNSFSGSGWSLVSQYGQFLTFSYSGTLGVGDIATLTLNVDVGQSAYPEVINSVSVTSSTFDPVDSNNSNSDVTPVINSDLSLSEKTVLDLNGGYPEPGDTLQYTITLTESGGMDAQNVMVIDSIAQGFSSFDVDEESLPAEATVTLSETGGAYNNGYFIIENITVPASSSVTIVFNAIIDSGAWIGTTFDNTAYVFTGGTYLTLSAPTVTVGGPGPASGIKPLYLHNAESGEELELSRNMPTTTESYEIPANAYKTWTLTPALGDIFIADGGDDNFIDVVLWLSSSATGSSKFTIQLGTPADPDYIGYFQSNWESIGVNTPEERIFRIQRSSPVELSTGSEITLTISYSRYWGNNHTINLHPIGAGNEYSRVEIDTDTVINVDSVEFYDAAYPEGDLIGSSGTLSGRTVYARAAVSDPFGSFDITGAKITITDPGSTTLVSNELMTEVYAYDPGITKIYEYEYPIPAAGPAGIWSFYVVAEEGEEGEITHTAIRKLEVSVITGADLSIRKSHKGNFSIKQNNDYTINVTNLGPEAESGIISVTDTLPAGLTYVSSEGTGWAVDVSGDPTIITWSYTPSSPILPGEELPPITLTVYVEEGAPPEVTNEAIITDTGHDGFLENNSSKDTASVVELSITKEANLINEGVYWPDDPEIASGADYTITVKNNGSGVIDNIEVSDILPDGVTIKSGTVPQVTVPSKSIRVTEYYLASGQFTGTSYNLALDNDLAPNYFVIVQGSDGKGNSGNHDRGPDENYARLTADPFGTGDLGVSSADNIIRLQRGHADDSWVGVITVVESLGVFNGSGFVLRDVKEVAHNGSSTGGSAGSLGWTDINQVMLMGGYNGAGCSTSEYSVSRTNSCHARIWPSGNDTINWSRSGFYLSTAVSTVMVVQWGDDWTVQRVNVTGSNGGNGANDAGEYNTANLSAAVSRANTWVWGTGHSDHNGIGSGSEGVLITLGDGVNQNASEDRVSIGSEYSTYSSGWPFYFNIPINKDFEVYALTHSGLAVDYEFIQEGFHNSLITDVPMISASSDRMALVYNGCNGDYAGYPLPMFSARYSANNTVRLERRRAGESFPAWIQGIDFSGITGGTVTNDGHMPPVIVEATDGYSLAPGESMVITYQTNIDPYSPGLKENRVYTGGPTPATAFHWFELRSYGDPQFVDMEGNQIAGSVTYSGESEEAEAIYLKVVDLDQNKNAGLIETIIVTVASPKDDTITVTLYETGPDTGIFANDSNGDPYELPLTSDDTPNIDTLYVEAETTSELVINYEDDVYPEKDFKSTGLYIVTRAVISSFTAYRDSGNTVIQWETASELGTAGFYLVRKNESTGRYERVNKAMLPGLLHSPGGGIYRFVDNSAVEGDTCTYKLEEVETRGRRNIYGPFTVTVAMGTDYDLPAMTSDYSRIPHQPSDTADRVKLESAGPVKLAAYPETDTPGDRIRIAVTKPGLYYISASEIASNLGLSIEEAFGLIINGDLFLTNQGEEVSWFAEASSGIYFYGEAIESIYTKDNIYWLSRDKGLKMAALTAPGDIDARNSTNLKDAITGMQVLLDDASHENLLNYSSSTADVNGNSSVDMAEIIYILRKEAGLINFDAYKPVPSTERLAYNYSVKTEKETISGMDSCDDPQADFWFWDILYSLESEKAFDIITDSPADDASYVTLTAHLFGGTNTSHTVSIKVNDNQLGTGTWSGNSAYDLTVNLDSSLLEDGTNVVTLSTEGSDESLVYVDSFTIDYQRYYQAKNNVIIARGDSNDVITINGFTDSDIRVFDISNTKTPVLFSVTTIEENEGAYSVSFKPENPDALYLAAVLNESNLPESINGWTTVNLHEPQNIDYLVIAPEDLKETAQKLADYRRTKGLKSLVVSLEDILAEFNSGIYDPQAIKDFLTYTYESWIKAPDYVVLAGKGTYDYKNNLKQNNNLIPPMLINTPTGIFASDNSFADISGNDRIPEMAIGRLPVTSRAELQTVTDKIIAYESGVSGEWTNRVLMVADNPDTGGNFSIDSDNVASKISAEYSVEKIYLPVGAGEEAVSGIRETIKESINNGAFMLNYLGHGGYDLLADENILDLSDIGKLDNKLMQTIITALTCITGDYSHPDLQSLGELLLVHDGGGAIAVWSPTGTSINDKAAMLGEEFFKVIFEDGEYILGDAILKALRKYNKRTSDSGVTTGIYNLLGDPALRFKGMMPGVN